MKNLLLSLCSLMLLTPAVTAAPFQVAQQTKHNTNRPVNVDRENRSQLSDKKSYRVIYTPNPNPIPLNKHFSLKVVIQDAQNKVLDDVKLTVDAGMPEHNHGMNVKPVVRSLGKGVYEVKGLLFHMPGYWEIYVDVMHKGKKERAVFGATLKMEKAHQHH